MRYSRQEEAQLAAKWEEGRGGGCRWKCLCEKANNEIGITRMYTNTNQVLKRWDRQRQKQEGERRKLPFLFHWLAFRTSFCNAKSERISAKGSSLPSCRPLTTEKMLSLSYSFLLQKKILGFEVGLNEDFAFSAWAPASTKLESTAASPAVAQHLPSLHIILHIDPLI